MPDSKPTEASHGQAFYGGEDWTPTWEHPDAPEVLKPTTDNVLQVEPSVLETIPVRVEGSVEAREMPAQQPAYKTFALDINVAQKILDANPRRKSALLIVSDRNGVSRGIAVGSVQSQAQENVGGNIPLYGTAMPSAFVHPPVPVTHRAAVWAIACGTACTVTVLEEMWTG